MHILAIISHHLVFSFLSFHFYHTISFSSPTMVGMYNYYLLLCSGYFHYKKSFQFPHGGHIPVYFSLHLQTDWAPGNKE